MRRLPLERGLADFAMRVAMGRYFPIHGLKQRAPQRSRSSVLRVTIVRSCCKLVAAIRPSITGNGWPRASDSPAFTPNGPQRLNRSPTAGRGTDPGVRDG